MSLIAFISFETISDVANKLGNHFVRMLHTVRIFAIVAVNEPILGRSTWMTTESATHSIRCWLLILM